MDNFKRIDQDTYEVHGWTLKFGNKFGFDVYPKNSHKFDRLRGGVYYYTGRIDIMFGKKLPKKIHDAVLEICKQRHQEGLMPNKR